VVLVISVAVSDRVRPAWPSLPASPSMVMATPCWASRLASVVMSWRWGRLARVKVSGVSKLAAISGSAAFLAPLMGMDPSSRFPPRIRILSINPLESGSGPPGGMARTPLRHAVPVIHAHSRHCAFIWHATARTPELHIGICPGRCARTCLNLSEQFRGPGRIVAPPSPWPPWGRGDLRIPGGAGLSPPSRRPPVPWRGAVPSPGRVAGPCAS